MIKVILEKHGLVRALCGALLIAALSSSATAQHALRVEPGRVISAQPVMSVTRLLVSRGKDIEVRDPVTLALLGTIPASTWGYGNASGVAMRDGYAYIGFYDGGKIVRYDLVTGTQGPVWNITSPRELVFAGPNLYVYSDLIGVQSFDVNTGAVRVIEAYTSAPTLRFLSGNSLGRLYAVMLQNDIAVQINTASTGYNLVFGSPTWPIYQVGRVVASPDGSRVYASSGQGQVLRFDAQTGQNLTPLGPNGQHIPALCLPVGLAVSPDNTTLYIADAGCQQNNGFTNTNIVIVEVKTMYEKAPRVTVPIQHRVAHLSVDPGSGLVYGTTVAGIYVLNPSSGALVTVDEPSWCIYNCYVVGSLAVGPVPLRRVL